MSTTSGTSLQIIENILHSLTMQVTQHKTYNVQQMQYEISTLCNWMRSQIDEYQQNMHQSLFCMHLNENKHSLHNKIQFEEHINGAKLSFMQCLKACDLFQHLTSNKKRNNIEDKCIGKWADENKGKGMILTESKTMVRLQKGFKFKSIRMESGISNGMKVEFEYALYCTRLTGNFIGVTSERSKRVHFNKRAMDECGAMLDCYGIDTCSNRVYLGNDHRFVETEWHKTKQEIEFLDDKQRRITMIVDMSNEKKHLLLFYMDSKHLYSIILPNIEDSNCAAAEYQVWYPAISLSRADSWCKIIQTRHNTHSIV